MKAYKEDSRTPIMKSKSVAVVGGGNVAMDAARCAKRLGAENVYIVYRRGMAELPARKEEVEHAEEEGIIFKTLTNPTEVLGDENGWVKGMTCVEMELGEPDASGRRRPIVKEGSEFVLEMCIRDRDDAQLPPSVDDTTIRTILEKIKNAKRPVFHAGYGIRRSGGYAAFRSVAEKLNIPIVTYWNAVDLIEDDNPLYWGAPATWVTARVTGLSKTQT